jgi:hypothetical protein
MTRERVETIAGVAALLLFCVFCVYREGVEIIPGMAGILLLGVFYGYLIGRVAKRRSWRGKNVKWVALLPFLPMFMVCLGSPDAFHFAEAGQAWTMFGFIWLMAGFVAELVAAKIAGVPLSELGSIEPRDLPDTGRKL